MENYKKCTLCNEIKPIDCFYIRSKKEGSRRSRCKYCISNCNHDELNKRKDRSKDYYKRNKEVIKNKSLSYYRENKVTISEKRKSKYKESPKPARLRARNYRKLNSDKIKAYSNSPNSKLSRLKSKNKFTNAHKARQYFNDHKKGNVLFYCEKCKSTNRVEAHHHDYNLPMEVTFLCKQCHVDWHVHNTPLNRETGIFTQEKK